MVRISAIFIAACMVLIAISLGIVVYLRFGFTGAESALVALGILTALAVYNAVSARLRDRAEASAQISTLSRSSGDLARQLAEFGLRLNTMDTKVEHVLNRSLQAAQPLAAEIEELSTLVQQLADSVAAHQSAIGRIGAQFEAVAAARQAGSAVRVSDVAIVPPLLFPPRCRQPSPLLRHLRRPFWIRPQRLSRRLPWRQPLSSPNHPRRSRRQRWPRQRPLPRSNRRCRPLSGSIAPAS